MRDLAGGGLLSSRRCETIPSGIRCGRPGPRGNLGHELGTAHILSGMREGQLRAREIDQVARGRDIAMTGIEWDFTTGRLSKTREPLRKVAFIREAIGPFRSGPRPPISDFLI
jgi:hypothetical protein